MEDELTVNDFRFGERVQFHPATDQWMRGERYGTVMHVGRTIVYVEGDHSRVLFSMAPYQLLHMKGPSTHGLP
jgi:predicted metal-dependent RNase